MIILALAIGALCLWAGYQWGKDRGISELERKVVRHVIDSPEYGNQMVDAIRKSLKWVKRENIK